MTVTLSPEHEECIQSEIDSGRYEDANEVVLAAMGKLDMAEQMLQLLLVEPESLKPALLSELRLANSHSERLKIAVSVFSGC